MQFKDTARRLLKEPLVHFLIAGALVFALLSGRAPDLGERRIVVDEKVVGALVGRFYDSFRRLPTKDETDGLIADWVRDQVYYREALALGLDQNDEVVVRRMRRKMETLAVADAETRTPSDAELQAMIDKDPARYAEDPRVTFQQVYLGADTPENRLKAEAELARLRKGEQVSGLPAPIPARMDNAGSNETSGLFGDEFTLNLRRLPVGQWTGPVASGLGLHLVRIERRAAAEPPKLAKVRQRVENDWRAGAGAKARDEAYQRILKGYDVVIELPK
ncbi:MAG: peptidyl-prolyl cis-trans isomerase [Sphingomonadales bacterium]|nr:peptidyl-prolyl cis-trans isomerase [Sphingomonadales bacterium]